MKVLLAAVLVFNICSIFLVDMAPVMSKGNTELTQEELEKEDMEFEKFFENLQPEEMENAIQDMQEVVKFDKDLLPSGSSDLLLQNEDKGASSTTAENSKDDKKKTATMKTENNDDNGASSSSKKTNTATSPKNKLSKNEKINSRVKRSYSRSEMMGTMGRMRSSSHNSYYAQWRQNRESMCRRRCYWRRMFYLCRYGRHMTQSCNC